MRRRIIKPIKEGLEFFSDRKKSSIKILDVATGSGRTLKQLRALNCFNVLPDPVATSSIFIELFFLSLKNSSPSFIGLIILLLIESALPLKSISTVRS